MLTIIYRYNDNDHNRRATWFVGDEDLDIPARYVVGLEATEDEADHIDEMFGGGLNREVPRYYGDFARTIYLNLGTELLMDEDDGEDEE